MLHLRQKLLAPRDALCGSEFGARKTGYFKAAVFFLEFVTG